MIVFVKTRIRSAFRFIKIEEENLDDVVGFVKKGKHFSFVSISKINIILQSIPALAAHSIVYQETLKFRMVDQHSTPISGQDFGNIIKQFHKSGCFFIEIIIINGVNDMGNDLTEVFFSFKITIKIK